MSLKKITSIHSQYALRHSMVRYQGQHSNLH